MTLDEYQISTRRTRPELPLQRDDQYRAQLAESALGVCGEAGEVSEPIKKFLFKGKPFQLEKLTEELGDVLFYVSWLADIHDIKMSDVASYNQKKLAERYKK